MLLSSSLATCLALGSHACPLEPSESLHLGPLCTVLSGWSRKPGVGVIAGLMAICASPVQWPTLPSACPCHLHGLPTYCPLAVLLPTASPFSSSAHCCATGLLVPSPVVRPETVPCNEKGHHQRRGRSERWSAPGHPWCPSHSGGPPGRCRMEAPVFLPHPFV